MNFAVRNIKAIRAKSGNTVYDQCRPSAANVGATDQDGNLVLRLQPPKGLRARISRSTLGLPLLDFHVQ